MNKKRAVVCSSIFLFLLVSTLPEARAGIEKNAPKVEVVFCLDTTGSMGGLIEGAKQKIWSIANQIADGKPAPQVSVGLVGYRDKGDAYVTKIFDLNSDLDGVYENLMSFKAEGGGDSPEHVNKALYDAVKRINWGNDDTTLKIIFLVGDWPPHMDYDDGYDYRDICAEALRKGVIINTVQCGSESSTTPVWQEIAMLSQGEYAQIQQDGAMRFVATPFDRELARLNREYESTVVVFGDASQQVRGAQYKSTALSMPAISQAERVTYNSKVSTVRQYDLIDQERKGSVDLKKLSKEHLPKEMKEMDIPAQKEYLEKKQKERENITKQISDLSKKRNDYLKEQDNKKSTKDSFDEIVRRTIGTQASSKGIVY